MSSETNCSEVPRLLNKEPDIIIKSEASIIEIWSLNCDGLHVVRYTIQPNALTIPFFYNAAEMAFFIQGELTLALFINGCPNKSDGEENECQQIYRYRGGDVGARRAGEVVWSYTTGNDILITVSLIRVTDGGGLRVFSLGGPQNLLNGFSSDFITDAFNVNSELAMKLQRKDPRGNTIYLTRGELHFSDVIDSSSPVTNNSRIAKLVDSPKEVLCTTEAGYFTTIDVHKFPFLESVHFSGSYNLMFKDVMRLPHWENTQRILYVVKGEGRIQVADDNGKNVFDDDVNEGRILVVPKFMVMAEKANSERFEYVTFKPNANPISYDVSGRKSVVYGLPLAVVTNAFSITEEEAKKVKFAREETSLATTMPKNI
ncbi:11S globulin seed storage protein 1 [Euphorbia peplus]|nr:11S globulin seed storage protein 1 [Euphorbia peplus]